jgi:hypothetical protein
MISITKAFKGLYRLCECECGTLITCTNKKSKLGRFVVGHNIIGKKGKDHPMYKHGKYVDNYPVIRINGIQIRTHVYVFQEYYQCCMLPWGEVHHKDGDIHNFDITNLEGYTHGSHKRIHMMGNKYAVKKKQ